MFELGFRNGTALGVSTLEARMNNTRFQPSDVSFHHVADLYLSELRNGAAPSLSVLAKAFPHLANEIRDQLPTLALLERTLGKPQATVDVQVDAALERNRLVDTGAKLGGCEIIREVGRGAVGVVYEALQRELGRKVAVKVISLQGSASSISVERFELERQAMGRVEHPHIVPVYSYGHNDDDAYLVMKLIDGHSLYELQSGGGNYRTQFHMNELRTNWIALTQLARDVASGLHHAHQQGLVHRDIKPANLLLDVEGKCWISDFGLAKVYDYIRSISHTGDAIGTPRYMAPEQLRGVCDCRSDVYALGVTLYEIAAGEKVWGGLSNVSLLVNRGTIELADIAEVRPDLPTALCKIIMKACQFAPDDRYQTAEELRIVLDRLLAGSSVGDRRKRRRDPDSVFRRVYRRNLLLGILFVSSVSFAGGMLYLESQRERDSHELAAKALSLRTMPVEPSGIGLIDKLADESEGDMVEIVKEFVNDSIGKSGDDLKFSSPAKEEIRHQVNHLLGTIKQEGGLTEASLNKFLKGYRETSLPVATRIMRLSVLVQKSSGLSRREKEYAIAIIHSLASATASGRLTESEAMELVDGLTKRHLSNTAEIATLDISDTRLREWLEVVRYRLSTLPPADVDVERAVQRQLQQAFEGAVDTPPPRPQSYLSPTIQ